MLQDWRREEENMSMRLKIYLNSLVLHFIFNLINAFSVDGMINVLENRIKQLKYEVLEV